MMNKLNYKASEKKSSYVGYLLFAIGLSIIFIFLGYKSNLVSFIGEGETCSNPYEGPLVTGFFLLLWLLYGIVIGYMKKKGFIQFLSFFWGIGGSINLTADLMAPIGKFAYLVLPVEMLTLIPNYSLKEYLIFSSVEKINMLLFMFISALFSWLAGAIGYFLGLKLKISFIQPANKTTN